MSLPHCLDEPQANTVVLKCARAGQDACDYPLATVERNRVTFEVTEFSHWWLELAVVIIAGVAAAGIAAGISAATLVASRLRAEVACLINRAQDQICVVIRAVEYGNVLWRDYFDQLGPDWFSVTEPQKTKQVVFQSSMRVALRCPSGQMG